MAFMDATRYRLLRSLNRRGFCTGTEIGAQLGLTRAAVHNHVRALVAQGVPIHRVPGRGYRLADGVSLLDATSIASRLSERARALLAGVDVLEEVDSTSAELARGDWGQPLQCRVCLAEKQTAGRGRRGRSWTAAAYRDVMMSIGIAYPRWPEDLPTLGLVAALTIVEALEQLGVSGLAVKWPNDVVHEHDKLCGVLLDVTGEAHGACRVTLGIGINVSSRGGPARCIDQRWTELDAILAQPLDRNTIVAQCLDRLLPALEAFPAAGFAPHRAAWRRRDALREQRIAIHAGEGTTHEGQAAGVDAHGRLRVIDADGRIRVFTQGDVSVRLR